MNRKNFLASLLSLGGALTIPSVLIVKGNTQDSEKIGFIHVEHLPWGNQGDWAAIDNKTGKMYKHPKEKIGVIEYCIQWADDKSGILGGITIVREQGPTEGVMRPWSEKCDITLKYTPRTKII